MTPWKFIAIALPSAIFPALAAAQEKFPLDPFIEEGPKSRDFFSGSLLPQFFIVLVVVAVVSMLIYCALHAARRRKDLAAWARSRQLRFTPAKDTSLDDRFPQFDCLRKGRSRYGYNLMDGQWGPRPILAFDYRYVTGSGKNQSTHHFSAVVLHTDVPLKPLWIRPEGFFDKIGAFFGFDDIDFESAEFSKRFYVKSPDRKWAYDVLHTRAMEFLMSFPTFSICFDRGCAIAYRSGTFTPEDFGTAANVLAGLLDRLPDYVIQQQKGSL